METFRSKARPFVNQYYYSPEEFECIASDALSSVRLLPPTPEPIRVDRFIEKKFNVVPLYEELPDGLLGFTKFGAQGVEAIVVSKGLAEETAKPAERRINSTLAHEAGHILLHHQLFTLQLRRDTRSLLDLDLDEVNRIVLCRDEKTGTRHYDGRWWEYQANQMIGTLLMPRSLLFQALEPLLTFRGLLGVGILENDRRETAARSLADTFDINPSVARVRITQIYPESEGRQLTL